VRLRQAAAGLNYIDGRSGGLCRSRRWLTEVRLIEADRLVRLPDAISFDQAAAMMLQV